MKQSHVLIVEDEPIISDVLKQYLEKDNFYVSILSSGNSVTSFVQVKQVDLILLDIGLPDKDGITIYHEIRAFSKVPVILLGEEIEDIDRLLGINISKDLIVCKPFLPEEVVAQVNAILSGK